MALSGSFNTSKFTTQSSGTIGLNISWTATQNIANNTSTIKWTVKSNGTMSSGYHIKCYKVIVKINGTNVINTSSEFNMYGGGKYKKTGSITVTHGADGKKTVAMSAQANIYYSGDGSAQKGSKSFTLNTITRYALLSTVEDFTDEGNPTIVYTNPAGTSLVTDLKARIVWNDGESGTEFVNLDDEGGTYTFNLDSYRSALRSACSDSNTLPVTFDLQSTLNGTEYHHTKAATMSIINANPVILSGILSYQDIDSITVGRTGNNQIIVQGQSTLRIHADSSKVTPQKNSTISSYSLNFNETDYTPDSSGNVSIIQPGYIGIYTATLTVTDSRGNSSTSGINITIHELANPSAIYSIKRLGNFYDQTILYVDGKISSIAGTNALTITGKYRKRGESSWSAEFSVPDAQNYYINGETGLDNKFEWEVLITVADKYYTRADAEEFPATTYLLVVSKGIPTAFFDTKRHSFSVNGFPDADEQLFVGGTIKAKPNETDNGIMLPHTYSREEQVVGYWVDGREIYELTVLLNSTVSLSANANTNIISMSNLEALQSTSIVPLECSVFRRSGNPVFWGMVGLSVSGGYLQGVSPRDSAITIDGFVLRYYYPN